MMTRLHIDYLLTPLHVLCRYNGFHACTLYYPVIHVPCSRALASLAVASSVPAQPPLRDSHAHHDAFARCVRRPTSEMRLWQVQSTIPTCPDFSHFFELRNTTSSRMLPFRVELSQHRRSIITYSLSPCVITFGHTPSCRLFS